MSRRKQTKPFKVEDKPEIKKDRKLKPGIILPKTEEQGLSQSYRNSVNFSDVEESIEGDARRPKRGPKCNECGKVLASTLSLARHKLTHSESKPYRCPKCGAGFKTSSNMHRHLRIHFREMKEQSDSELVVNKSRSCTQRSPRQNIRTPTKFREFDVDLVGVVPRSTTDLTTYARAYSKAKDPLRMRKQVLRPANSGKRVNAKGESSLNVPEDQENEELPDLNVPRVRRSSTKPEDLVCHLCHKTFISKFGLLTHTMSHSNTSTDSVNKCNLCDQSFTTPKGLSVHNVIVHKIAKHKEEAWKRERSFQEISIIDFSATKFPEVAEVACSKSHCDLPLRDAQHIFLCKKCDKAFPLLEALEIHMKKKKVEHIQPQKSEICMFLASVNLQNKEENGTIQDSEQESYSVQNGIDDDNIFTSKSVAMEDTPSWLKLQPNMTETSYQKETDVTPVRPELNFFRRIPLLTTSDSSAMVPVKYLSGPLAPLRSAPHNRRRTRNQVDSATLLKNIEPSIRPVDNEKGDKNIFWCRICNYSSREKSALIRHLLTHSGIRPYFCKICDYAFTTKANCERHVRKRHNCAEKADLDAAVRCDWEMLKMAPREDIYMISGNSSNSTCPVCNESFASNEDLKQHLKIHEERHFLCQLCNVRCITRNNCVRHILHKHPGIPHHETNNIITFVGNGKNDLDMDNFEDIVQDKSDIDISKGRIGGKRSGKPLSDWPKSTFRNPRSLQENLPHKKPRMGAPPTTNLPDTSNVADDQDSNIPMSLSESDEWNEDREENIKRQVTCIPLVPLLKIKAYNEAAARSYADMVALYQHLNFLNSAENDVMTMDDTIMPMMETPPRLDDEEDFTNGETMFICQSCGESFNTEDRLNSHIVLCESDAKETSDQIDEHSRMMIDSDENGNGGRSRNVFLTDAATINARMGVKGHADGGRSNLENEWDLPGLEDSLGAQVYDTTKNPLDGWPNHSATNSPFLIKPADDAAVLDCDSPFTNERQIPISSSTCVEDSLLMTMFADEDSNENFEGHDSSIRTSQTGIMSRYSSSLPTMVNMESPTMTAMKFQGGSSLNSQLDVPDGRILPTSSRGKMQTGRKCPQCSKVFPWASSLRRHIMTHTGLKLYMCRLCKMRFTTRSNLIRHVYRRHGMAKQHPDFASCLAKLHPSDALLREVEADVRRKIDGRKKRKPTPGGDEILGSYEHDKDSGANSLGKRRKKGVTNDFQSMLEEDPDTLLVDLDYSPRDDLIGTEDKKPSPVTESPKLSEEKVKSIEGTKLLAIEAAPPATAAIKEESNSNESPAPVEEPTASTAEEPAEESSEESEIVTVKFEPPLATEEPVPIPSVTTSESQSNPKKLRRRSETKSTDSPTTRTPSSTKNSTQSPKKPKEAPKIPKKALKTPKEAPKTPKEAPKTPTEAPTTPKEAPKTPKEAPKTPKGAPKTPKEAKEEPSLEERSHPKTKARSKQSSQFVCGLCKKIFKTVPDLLSHLDDHNVPHCWHCSICTVPFTNKYNCQRHLTRRHGRADLEPLYVEDEKHGPRNPKGQIPKSNNVSDVQCSK